MELQDYVTRTYPEDSYRFVGFTLRSWKVRTDLLWCTCYMSKCYISFPLSLITCRLSKLLLRLPALRLISAAVTEELFFAGLIGNVQIDSIIPYILKMESTDYNSQAVSGVWHTMLFGTRKLDCENSTANHSEYSAEEQRVRLPVQESTIETCIVDCAFFIVHSILFFIASKPFLFLQILFVLQRKHSVYFSTAFLHGHAFLFYSNYEKKLS